VSAGYRCDAPECNMWAGERSHMHNWVMISTGLAGEKHREHHFCSKSCATRWLHQETRSL
jgi:hypothetical protein